MMKRELIDLSDQAWDRLRTRVDGLTDPEYFWEPVTGCLNVRRGPAGAWRADEAAPGDRPAPFTSLAWRLWHVIDLYGEDRAPQWLDVPPQGDPIGLDDPTGAPPSTADEATALLERAHDRWDAHVRSVTDEQLGTTIGDVGGRFGDQTKAAYVLHMLDEFIHHGAEIALLRDLWQWQARPDPTH